MIEKFKTRNDKIVILYNSGMTLSEIGKKFNISKQRVWQIAYVNKCKRRFADIAMIFPHPSISELYVSNILKKNGFNIQNMPYNNPFDILVNKKIRIEVKYRNINKGNYCHINNINNDQFDFIIIFIEIKNMRYLYIIPSKDTKTSISVPVNPLFITKKQRKYLNNFNQIKCFIKN